MAKTILKRTQKLFKEIAKTYYENNILYRSRGKVENYSQVYIYYIVSIDNRPREKSGIVIFMKNSEIRRKFYLSLWETKYQSWITCARYSNCWKVYEILVNRGNRRFIVTISCNLVFGLFRRHFLGFRTTRNYEINGKIIY